MKLARKRVWSMLLIIALLVTMIPSTVNAKEQGVATEATNSTGDNSQVASQASAQDTSIGDSAATDTSNAGTESTDVSDTSTVETPTSTTDSNTVAEATSTEESTTPTDVTNTEESTTVADQNSEEQTADLVDAQNVAPTTMTYYIDQDGIDQSVTATVINSSTTTLTDSNTGGYYIAIGDVTVNQTLSVSGDVKLILADDASLTVIGEANHAGIEVTINNSISIYSQSSGNGTLDTTGGASGAGIGGLNSGVDITKQIGVIRIYGGHINATGGADGAGIGSGSGSGTNDISIYGGTIKAIGGVNGSGIGSAARWQGFGSISIYGGTIQAIRGANYPLDIGGYGGAGDRITINGGTIFGSEPDGTPNLLCGDARGFSDTIIIINGGSIRAHGIHGEAKNDAGQVVDSNQITLPARVNESATAASINNVSCANIPDTTHGVYGIKDVSTSRYGYICFFLPESNNVEPVNIVLDHSTNYWAAYARNVMHPEITLKQLTGPAIYPDEAGYTSFNPTDIVLAKNDFGSSFAGIYNGNTALVQGTDYTISGDMITFKPNYLNTLPNGFSYLSFDYGLGSHNPIFRLSIIGPTQYVAIDDGMTYESELDDVNRTSYGALVSEDLNKSLDILSEPLDSNSYLRIFDNPMMSNFLSSAEIISLNLGTYDVYSGIFEMIANEFHCKSDLYSIQSQLVNLMQTDQATLNTALANLNSTDGTGLINNNVVQTSINNFSGNFQGIISKIKTYAPNARIYVINLYNPYKGITIPYAGGTLDLGAIMDTYIQSLNATFDQNSTDYSLIDTYTTFSSSNGGTSLLIADGSTYNLNPFPNEAGHAKLAELISARVNNDLSQTVSSVSLSQNELNLTKNDAATLSATVLPATANNKGVTWSSSNSNVASVDNTGKVTALSAGSAVITVTTQDQGKTASCSVTVKEAQTVPVNPPKDTPTDVPKDVPKDTPTDAPKDVPQTIPDKVAPILISQLKVNTTSITLAKKATLTLSTTVAPESAANKNVTWSSSDATIATVSSTGTITAVSAGKATITATAQDGSNITASCVVTVPKNASYKIKYKLNKGVNAATNPSYYASGVKLKLEKSTRSKYTFIGWFLDDTKVTSISKSTKGNITLTAKWEKITVAKTTVKKVKNDKPSALSVSYDKVSGAKGYTVYYSTNKDMSNASQLDVSSKKASATISNLVSGSTYYVTVKAYKTDSLGDRIYGKSNKTVKVVINK